MNTYYTEERRLEDLIDEINKSVEELRANEIDPNTVRTPSSLEVFIPGVSNLKGVAMLFSDAINQILVETFKLIETGNIDEAMKAMDRLVSLFKKAGIGDGNFEGPVSKTVINTVINTVQSPEYKKIKSSLFKSLTTLKKMNYIIKKLKQQTKKFPDKETKKKYLDSVYALKRALKIAIKVYENRKLINDRFKKGLMNIVKEDVYDTIERVRPIE